MMVNTSISFMRNCQSQKLGPARNIPCLPEVSGDRDDVINACDNKLNVLRQWSRSCTLLFEGDIAKYDAGLRGRDLKHVRTRASVRDPQVPWTLMDACRVIC